MFLVTNKKLMRGVDYRVLSGTEGISLLVMSCFESTRAYIQALGRVGRFNEQAKRFIWDRLQETVDKDAEIGTIARLRAKKLELKSRMTMKKPKAQQPQTGVHQVSLLTLFKR